MAYIPVAPDSFGAERERKACLLLPPSLSSAGRIKPMQPRYPAKRAPLSILSRLFSSTSQPIHSTNQARYALPSFLKTSAGTKNLRHGSAAHAVAIKNDFTSDPFIATSIIDMYCKCGVLNNATHLFDELPHRDAPTWNSMIDGYFRHGIPENAFSCFNRMQRSGLSPDGHSFSILFSGVGDSAQLGLGRQAHAFLLKNIPNPDEFITTALITMYLKCNQSSSAITIFRYLSKEMKMNVPSIWNSMIGGLRQMGNCEMSLEFYSEMKRWRVSAGAETYSTLLAASFHGGDIDLVGMIHADVAKAGLEEEPHVCTSLVSVYGKLGAIKSAKKVFSGVKEKRTELCNSMISAFVFNDCPGEAIRVYNSMNGGASRADSFTIVNSLAACSSSFEMQKEGEMIHGQLVKIPEGCCITVATSLVTMYWRWGRIEESSLIFESVKEKDEALWGSMVAGYCQNRKIHSAVSLLNRMLFLDLNLDSAILASITSAAARSEHKKLGFQVHGYSVKLGLDADIVIGSALIDAYAKSGFMDTATQMFSSMPEKNLVTWNSIISGYGRLGEIAKCIAAFSEMRISGIAPDLVSIISAVVGASTSAALISGKMIHAFQIRNQIENGVQIGNCLIEMYARCGCLSYARFIFDRMEEKSICTWNSMIAGYGCNGECETAVKLFEEMENMAAPDGITFLALISACNYRRSTELGIYFFNLMTRYYKIEPGPQHYAAMVDLLGRAGRLDEGFNLAIDSEIDGGDAIWVSLICGSRYQRNVGAGEAAARKLSKLEAGDHIQMWKLYGEAGMTEKAAEERRRMKEQGLRKTPGCSWIEVGGRVEVFYSGGASSPLQADMHGVLRSFKWILEEVKGNEEDGHL